MTILIQMPKLSDTMEEGVISEWFKSEGEFVEEGEPLLAIETDKATMEYASPEEGTILKIIEKAGSNVPLNQPIAIFGEKGESFNLEEILKDAKSSSQTASEPAAPAKAEESQTVQVETPSAPSTHQSSRIRVSPLARKMAASQGIDLSSLQGSGPNGRILQRDIEAGGIKSSQASLTAHHEVSPQLESKKIPHTMMRKTIAKRLLAGKNDAPHFYLTVSAGMDDMIKWRQSLNASTDVSQSPHLKVSLNDLIILSVAKALEKHPQVNSSWHDDHIMQHGHIDISMAVALPSGLITPVIHNANLLGVRGISKRAKELAKKAKDGRLQPDEYTGGTFTISNLGMTKVESFTAIINPPQACILAIGCSKLVPHVNEQGQIITQNRMNLTMSCDHRVVDGMIGARFLETLISYIENPLLMFT